MNIIENEQMPNGNGHYSTCIEHNGILYISGQIPINPIDKSIPDGIQGQTELVLQKLETILIAAKSDKNKVIQIRIYLSDMKNWEKVNEIYRDYFTDHKPARCVVPTGPLHYGVLIELEAIAHL